MHEVILTIFFMFVPKVSDATGCGRGCWGLEKNSHKILIFALFVMKLGKTRGERRES
jgi:hypothetical protein